MALKFGSPAWRKKYMGKPKKRNAAKKKKRSTSHSRATAHKKARMREMVREATRKNPPRTWMKVKAVRVIRKGGKYILEVRK
jgi:hypothetical protein